jgi:hypothetical protein
LKKWRQKEFEALEKEQQAVDLKAYLASFKKDRQGVIASVEKPKLPAISIGVSKPLVSDDPFTPDHVAIIQHYVFQGTTHVYDLMTEHATAKKNTPPNWPSENQLVSRNRDNQLVSWPTRQPTQVVCPLGSEPALNQGSVLWAQDGPMANSSLVPTDPSANPDDPMEKFRRELDQIVYEKFGVTPKNTVYTQPYPEYFDKLPYPPSYRVPDFAKSNGVDIVKQLGNMLANT